MIAMAMHSGSAMFRRLEAPMLFHNSPERFTVQRIQGWHLMRLATLSPAALVPAS